MFVVFVRIQVSEVSLYWSNVLQASAKKKRKVFNKRDQEKCMISPRTFYFVADHSLVRSWSNNRKKSNGRESGGLRVVTSLFCAPALKIRLILCCVNFVSMRTVKQSKFYISSLIIGVLVKEKQRRRTSSHQIRIDKAFYAILHLIHQKPAVSPPNLHLPWTWQILKVSPWTTWNSVRTGSFVMSAVDICFRAHHL